MSVSTSDLNIQSKTLPLWQLIILILLVGLFILNFIILNIDEKNRAGWIRETDNIRITSQQLSQYAKDAAAGRVEAFDDLKRTKNIINQSMKVLDQGDDDLAPLPPATRETFTAMQDTWQRMDKNVDVILNKQELIESISDIAVKFAREIPVLQARSDDVVQRLVKKGANRQQIYVASQQLVLADRMLRRMNEILQGGMNAVQAADRLDADARKFANVLNGLFNGSDTIKGITDPVALEALGGVYNQFDSIQNDIQTVLKSMDLFEAQTAAEDIQVDSLQLLDQARELINKIKSIVTWFPSTLAGWILGALALLWMLGIFWRLNRSDRIRAKVAQDLNERNQQAILRLLDEMGSLADGDLTVNATVSEDITGAIADSVNFAVEALRSLVTTINEASVGVASAAQEAQATAMHLAEASEHQAQQITNASAAINEIAVSIDEVSKNSLESADVAQRSVQIAHTGADVVRQTIEGMDNIRNQIQETSKRIKRLGESSQEIGNIVELINDIAEQTNILALNAAIQAASAGESGRGFAVVADEVQRLAERASSATRQIENLVQTIQSDTNEAVASMEQTTSEVVNGAKRAENAGEALVEIETVSTDLAELIQNISEAARQQSVAATNISGTMNVIQEITTQTSAGTQQTAESIGNLVELANELRRSVEGFKLPEDDDGWK